MSALHPNLVHQLRVWAHKVGRAAVPDDQPADTLITDGEATKPRTKGDELFAAGTRDLDDAIVDFIIALIGCIVIGALLAGWL